MSKPLDERILYTKIMEFVKHPPTYDFHAELGNQEERKQDFIINLQYLSNHTKSNPKMMKENHTCLFRANSHANFIN